MKAENLNIIEYRKCINKLIDNIILAIKNNDRLSGKIKDDKYESILINYLQKTKKNTDINYNRDVFLLLIWGRTFDHKSKKTLLSPLYKPYSSDVFSHEVFTNNNVNNDYQKLVLEVFYNFIKKYENNKVFDIFCITMFSQIKLDEKDKKNAYFLVKNMLKKDLNCPEKISEEKFKIYMSFFSRCIKTYSGEDFYLSDIGEDFLIFLNTKQFQLYNDNVVNFKNKIYRDIWNNNDDCLNQNVLDKYFHSNNILKTLTTKENSLSVNKHEFYALLLWEIEFEKIIIKNLKGFDYIKFNVQENIFELKWKQSENIKSTTLFKEMEKLFITIIEETTKLPKKEQIEYENEINKKMREIGLNLLLDEKKYTTKKINYKL